jgi:hypothetical protein
MRIYRSFLALTAVAGLWFGAGAIVADDTTPADPDRRARREAWCKENPEKCEQWKQKRAEREAFCKQNPETCEQQRAERKQRRAELQAKCAADPAKCDEMKQQMRERWKTRKGAGAPPAYDKPPTPPPAN